VSQVLCIVRQSHWPTRDHKIALQTITVRESHYSPDVAQAQTLSTHPHQRGDDVAILSTRKRDIFRRHVHAEVLHAALAQMATVKTLLVEASVMKRVMPFGSTAIPLSSEAGHTMCFTRVPSGERTAIFP